jgi:hypothetical protein
MVRDPTFGMNAVDELLLQLRSEHWRPSVFHDAVIGPANW